MLNIAALQQRWQNNQPHQTAPEAQTRRPSRDSAEDVTLTLRLKECDRKVTEQQRDVSDYKVRLPG